ncbi:MAG: sulfatase [Phycisphaerales bacterium]|nr:sulfatase [Phycisphaerales bacterium]
MTKKWIPTTAVLLIIVLGGGAFMLRSEQKRRPVADGPNVLLIVLDTTRADFFSCYGYPKETTPRMDAIAGEGVRFTNAFATDFWTVPSHATIFTGLYPSEAGTTSETMMLQPENVTLAERFCDAGYRTGAVVMNAWLSRECGFAQGFDDYQEAWRSTASADNPTAGDPDSVKPAEDVAAWIRGRVAEKQPFFMFVNINVPHLPFRPPARLRNRFLSKRYPPEQIMRITNITDGWGQLAGVLELSDEDHELMRDLYAAEIAFTDEWVGMIYDALAESGALDDTLLVITADHGENLGERGMIDHQFSMFDSTLHVPLIVRDPKCSSPGSLVSALTSLVDLAPTIMRYCNIDDSTDERLVGRNDLLAPERRSTPVVFSEESRDPGFGDAMEARYPDFDGSTLGYALRSLRTERYRLTVREGIGVELYDFAYEHSESRNVADEQPELAGQLQGELEAWFTGLDKFKGAKQADLDDEVTRKHLESLGYVAPKKKP